MGITVQVVPQAKKAVVTADDQQSKQDLIDALSSANSDPNFDQEKKDRLAPVKAQLITALD